MLEIKLLIEGFIVCAGLIIAIGAQNAFVISQGLKQEGLIIVTIVSSIGDIILFAVGIGAFSTIVHYFPAFEFYAVILGALFLFVFGLRAFYFSFTKIHDIEVKKASYKKNGFKLMMMAVGFSLLNPHAWLDTAVIAGGITASYDTGQKLSFIVGASCASVLWFTFIGYGSSYLSQYITSGRVWRYIDFFVGIVMWAVVIYLLRDYL